MCGIFGFLGPSLDNESNCRHVLQEGLSQIEHRGPDGHGIWFSSDYSVGLAHRRLSIIDVESGAQPMKSDDGNLTITFNGEIYNYQELRASLADESFKTTSDTEVLLKAYQRWGAGMLNRLRGMFAFVIWDEKQQLLFLARDRFGIKPLFWTSVEGRLYFASEIKALLPFVDKREISPNGLSDYFTYQFCVGAKTLFNGVHQVLPAHYGVFKKCGLPKFYSYWEVNFIPDYEHDEDWFLCRLDELLTESIGYHLVSDVEVGSYVSGGIDSSLMAALANKKSGSQLFKIFNGRFDYGAKFDESNYAKQLANEQNMELHIASITKADFVDNISRVIWHLDQPTAGPGVFPQYMVSKLSSKYLKVVLGGQGGDEIFGGYARYMVGYLGCVLERALEGFGPSKKFPISLAELVDNLTVLREYKPMLKDFWGANLDEPEEGRYFHLINRSKTFGSLINPEYLAGDSLKDEFRSIFSSKNTQQSSYFDAMAYFDFKTLLPALLHVEDRMSMAHGVEARVPLLDHKIVEFAATIPPHLKYKNGSLKRFLKLVGERHLPKKLTDRKDKMGFPVPLNDWVRQPGIVRDFVVDTMSSQKALNRPYFQVQVDVNDLLDHSNPYGRNLWALLNLELWQQQFID